jgi:O-antigen/teichoic acid export membrane protein
MDATPATAAASNGAIGATLLGLSRIWAQAVTLIVMLAVVVKLDPTGFGTFVIAASAYTALAILAGQGFYEYIAQARDDSCLSTVGWLAAAGATLAVVLGLALSLALPRIVGQADVGQLLLALVPLLYVAAISTVLEAVLLRDGMLGGMARGAITADTLGLVASLVGLWLGAGVFSLVIQRAVRELSLLACYLASRKWSPALRFAPAVAREAFAFALPLMTTRLVGNAGQLAINALMAALLSLADVGLFRLAQRVVLLVWDIFYQPLRASLWSRLPALAADRRAFGVCLLSAVESFGLGIFAIQMALIATAGGVIVLLLGPQWAAASSVVAALAIGRMVAVFSAPAEVVLALQGRGNAILFISMANLAASVIAVTVLSAHGLQAVATGSALATSVVAIVAARTTASAAGIHAAELRGLCARLAACAIALLAGAWTAGRLVQTAGFGPAVTIAVSLLAASVCYGLSASRLLPRGVESYRVAAATTGARLGNLLLRRA